MAIVVVLVAAAVPGVPVQQMADQAPLAKETMVQAMPVL
jgi:hypothetical protein